MSVDRSIQESGSEILEILEYLIFVFGGGLGLLINFYITSKLVSLDYEFWLSYSIGTAFNVLFNFMYHWFITFGVPLKVRAAFIKFTGLSFIAWILNILITSYIVDKFDWSTNLVIFIAVLLMSIGNYLISSTFIFSSTISPDLAIDRIEKIYSDVPDDFYDLQQATQNPIRSWFHIRRQELIQNTIKEFSQDYTDPIIVDMGCGNAAWNLDKISVIGVDMNQQLLEYAEKHGRITQKIVAPIHESNLPDDYADIVIISEVIEHLIDPHPVLAEIHRILKSNGRLLVTVPYDTLFSFWKPLFTLQCFLHGTIKRSYYYKNKCGHVNAYSPDTIRELLEVHFQVDKLISMRRFSIFIHCSKESKK